MLDLIFPDRNVCGPLIKARQKNSARLLLILQQYCKQLHFPCLFHCWVFNKCSPTTEGMSRPKSLPVYRTNAKETFVYSSSVSSIAEEYSHQHQCDRILWGKRNGILNSICSKHSCILKPLLSTYYPSLEQTVFTSELVLTLERYSIHSSNQRWQKVLQERIFSPCYTGNSSRSFWNTCLHFQVNCNYRTMNMLQRS